MRFSTPSPVLAIITLSHCHQYNGWKVIFYCFNLKVFDYWWDWAHYYIFVSSIYELFVYVLCHFILSKYSLFSYWLVKSNLYTKAINLHIYNEIILSHLIRCIFCHRKFLFLYICISPRKRKSSDWGLNHKILTI